MHKVLRLNILQALAVRLQRLRKEVWGQGKIWFSAVFVGKVRFCGACNGHSEAGSICDRYTPRQQGSYLICYASDEVHGTGRVVSSRQILQRFPAIHPKVCRLFDVVTSQMGKGIVKRSRQKASPNCRSPNWCRRSPAELGRRDRYRAVSHVWPVRASSIKYLVCLIECLTNSHHCSQCLQALPAYI